MRCVRLLLLLAVLALLWGCEDQSPVRPVADPIPETDPPSRRAWRVPGDHETVAGALASAAAGDTILIAPGTYQEHDLRVDRGLTVLGSGTAAEPVIIDAAGQGRVMTLASSDAPVIVRGLTITGGRFSDYRQDGAGLFCAGDSVRVEDCIIRDNHAPWSDGGGLAAYLCRHLVLDGCAFLDNSSNRYGGGAYVHFSTGTLTVRDCEFRGNSTLAYHDAGLVAPGVAVVESSVFREQRGTAALLGDGSVVRQTVFRENAGTALRLLNGCRVEDCTFVDNRTRSGGAAIAANPDLELHRSVFLRNASDWDGGAVQVYGGHLLATDCDFIDNTTGMDGGAIACGGADISGTRFIANTARDGGAIAASDITLTDCDFRENEAQFGAAVQSRTAELTGCALVGNTGHYEVVRVWGGLTLRRTTVAANRSLEGEAVLQFAWGTGSGPCVLEHTLIAFNEGEALADPSSSMLELTVRACNVHGNTAGDWVGPLAGLEGAEGNVALDPLFCDLAGADVALCADSPCLPPVAGDQVIGARDAGCVACGVTR